MRTLPAFLPACALAAAICLWTAPVALAGNVTVYRCTDASGRVMLRDSPCPGGQQQQVRQMQRPQDAPVRPQPIASTPATPPPPAVPQIMVVHAPRPMYECVRPDGQRYTSDTGEGNPRWVPLWTLGYPVVHEVRRHVPGHSRIVVDGGRVSGEFHSGHIQRGLRPTAAGYGAGTWVRDTCHPLPQAEVCARLRDERSALRTRFFNAQPTERDRINLQQRSIDARLASDCGETR